MNYIEINKQLNNEMQVLAKTIKSGEYTEKHRNRLSTIIIPKLNFFIWNFFKNQDDVEHVLAQTLMKIFSGISGFDPTYRFTTWMYRIATNESLYHLHMLKRNHMTSLETLVTYPHQIDESAETMEAEEFMDSLYKLVISEINEIPDSIEKEIIINKFINKMKIHDISEKFEINENTVKTKLRKARKSIRESILAKNPEIHEKYFEYL